MYIKNQILKTLVLSSLFLLVNAESSEYETIIASRSDVSGVGVEEGIMRREPSDIIKVGDLYYVWYSKGPQTSLNNATIWYATSKDGVNWTESGMSIDKSTAEGAWDDSSIFNPNILVADGRYWLFYSGISKKSGPRSNDTKIGAVVSDSPEGPWERLPHNPLLSKGEKGSFDNYFVDDACLVVLEGKYWLYYKGFPRGSTASVGIAIAEKPEGPYVKYEKNPIPLDNQGSIVAWREGKGVGTMMKLPNDTAFFMMYAEDGYTFKKTYEVDVSLYGAAFYRPEAFIDGVKGKAPIWGLKTAKQRGKLPAINRFDIEWAK